MDLHCSLKSYCERIPEENRWKLDKPIDFEHDGVSTHLGTIADSMDEWEGRVAEALGLNKVGVSGIKVKHPDNLTLQTREALHVWQENKGLKATYRSLIGVFLKAGKTSYAEAVCRVLGVTSKHDVPTNPNSSWTRFFTIRRLLILIALILIVCLMWWSGGFHWGYSIIMYRLNLPFSKTLPPRLKTFVGRENDTQTLLQLLRFHSDSDTKIVNIIGSPGFGKSTLAIEVGNKLIEERVVVHYVDMADFPNMQVKQVLAEKVLKSAIYTTQPNVTFDQLVDWVGRTVWYNLLILDNCDDSINQQKGDFYKAIATLVQYSQYLKILLTSREETMHLHDFRPYKIQTLTTSAACELLEYKIPSRLTSTEKEKIAELTGNVPLALQIIGSLLNMPDPPSPTEIIEQLGRDPISTLTPSAMWYQHTLNASISLSYNYLKPNLQKHGRYLANFPGSFDIPAATDCLVHISSNPQKTTHEYFESSVRKLVSLSLLEHNKRSDQYHFHRLIREFFLGVQTSSSGVQEKKRFNLAFQRLYSTRLREMTNKFHTDSSSSAALSLLERERHNVQHLLALVTSPVNIRHDSYYDAIFSIEYALSARYLGQRFTTEELIGPIQSVTDILQTEILNTAAQSVSSQNSGQLTSHFHLFTRCVIQLSKLRAVLYGRSSAFKTMHNRLYVVETFANQSALSEEDYVQGYTYYYTNLLHFREYLDDDNTKTYTARVLQKLNKWETDYCDPTKCQNKDIGYAYYRIEEYEKSIEFLEKALNDSDLELTTRIDTIVRLYISYKKTVNFEGCQKLAEELVHLYPNIVATFQSDSELSIQVILVVAIFRNHGEHERATDLLIRQIGSILESQTKIDILLVHVLFRALYSLAQELYKQSNYTQAVKLAGDALKSLDNLDQEKQEIWDIIVLQLKLKLIVGKGKYHNTTHEAVASEGVVMLMEVADYIIERNETTIYYSEFTEACEYLSWHLKYIYSCRLRDSDVLYYVNTISSGFLYSLFFIPLAVTEKHPAGHPIDEPMFLHDHPLPLDKYPPLRQQSHSKEVGKKEWSALVEFFPGFNEPSHSDQDSVYSVYLKILIEKVLTPLRHLLKIRQVRVVINVASVWIRLFLAYYCLLYTLKCLNYVAFQSVAFMARLFPVTVLLETLQTLLLSLVAVIYD